MINIGTSFNVFVSIDKLGGYMERYINLDKIILKWIANHTPPSCIRVNIISMELATNPNSKFAKMITCIKYIKNMHSYFPLITK